MNVRNATNSSVSGGGGENDSDSGEDDGANDVNGMRDSMTGSGRQAVASLNAIGDKLRGIILKENNRVSKSVCDVVLKCVSEYESLMMHVLCENATLRGRVSECAKLGDMVRECMRATPPTVTSYASVAAQGVSVVGRHTARPQPMGRGVGGPSVNVAPKPKFALVVKGGENESSEEVIERVKGMEGCESVRVQSMRAARNGGIVIETPSENDRECLRRLVSENTTGLNVSDPSHVRPRMIVYDVPNQLTEVRFLAGMYEKNLNGVVERDEYGACVKVVSRQSRPDAPLGNIVIEVDANVRARLLSQKRVYVEWGAYRVCDYVRVDRCYGCFSYAHMLRDCKSERLCYKCGKPGHKGAGCKAREDCGNCRSRNLKSNHSALSPECPEYKWRLERMRTRIST